jgi:tetratricopeptide (TPR) repeat protein
MSAGRWARAAVLVGAGTLLLAAAVGLLTPAADGPAASSAAARGATPALDPATSADQLSAAIARTQQRLRTVPADATAWADLGAAYVQQGRITVDATYYPKAEGALRRSLALAPTGNDRALVGLGALAGARHDFAAARTWALRATAVNRYSAAGYAVLADALTQLGDYPGATAAVQRGLDLKPGLSTFTRASYELEIHGRTADAEDAMRRALGDSTSGSDVAWCGYYLGELAFGRGDLAAATGWYEAASRADPSSAAAYEGRAKAAAAAGRTDAALGYFAAAVERAPLPQYLVEYGETLQAAGRPAAAAAQYALVGTETRLLAANGATDDLTTAQLAADHGSPAAALAAASAEWRRRHSVLVADALAWALHANHRDAQALPYARAAVRLGWHNAVLTYHLGMIEAALGQPGAARRDLAAALATNPYFSPLGAPLARAGLRRLAAVR